MNLILPTFLEIATNLTLVSLLLNLLDSEVEEFIAAFLQARARYLKKIYLIYIGGTKKVEDINKKNL